MHKSRLKILFLIVAGLNFLISCSAANLEKDSQNPSTNNSLQSGNQTAVLSGKVSYPSPQKNSHALKVLGKETATESTPISLTENDLKEQGVKDASVELFAVDDKDFAAPLTTPIATDSQGNYTVKEKDFKNKNNKKTTFIARAVFKSPFSNNKIMIKALVDSSNVNADINPLTFTIIEKINQVFSDLGLTLAESHLEILKTSINLIISQTKTDGIKFDSAAEIKVDDVTGEVKDSVQAEETITAINDAVNTGTAGMFTQLGEEIIDKKDEIEKRAPEQKIKPEKIKEQMTRSLLSLGLPVEDENKEGVYVYLDSSDKGAVGTNAMGDKNKNLRMIKPGDIKAGDGMHDQANNQLKEKLENHSIVSSNTVEAMINNKDKKVTLKEVTDAISENFVWRTKVFEYDGDGKPVFSDQAVAPETGEEVLAGDLLTQIRENLPKKTEEVETKINAADYNLFKIAEKAVKSKGESIKETSPEKIKETIRKSGFLKDEIEKLKHIYFSGIGRFYQTELNEDTPLNLKEAMFFFILLKERIYLINSDDGWIVPLSEDEKTFQINFANFKFLSAKEENFNLIEALLGTDASTEPVTGHNHMVEELNPVGNKIKEDVRKVKPLPELEKITQDEKAVDELVVGKLIEEFDPSLGAKESTEKDAAIGEVSNSVGNTLFAEDVTVTTNIPKKWWRVRNITHKNIDTVINAEKTEASVAITLNHDGRLYVNETSELMVKSFKDVTIQNIKLKKDKNQHWFVAETTATDVSADEPEKTFKIGRVSVSRDGKEPWVYSSEADFRKIPDELLFLTAGEEILVEVDLSETNSASSFFAYLHHDLNRDPLFDDKTHGDKVANDRIFSRKYKIGHGNIGRHQASIDVVNADIFKDKDTLYDSQIWRLPYIIKSNGQVKLIHPIPSSKEIEKEIPRTVPETKPSVTKPPVLPEDKNLNFKIGDIKLTGSLDEDHIEQIEVVKNSIKFKGAISLSDPCHSTKAWHKAKTGEIYIFIKTYRSAPEEKGCIQVITPLAFEAVLLNVPVGEYTVKFLFGEKLIKEEKVTIKKPEVNLPAERK